MADTEARWYVAHTYSGYENKVKADIENTIVNRNLQDQILEVYVPMQEVEREGKDSKKLVQQKMFPAYVLKLRTAQKSLLRKKCFLDMCSSIW